jgi:hypothetical protein
VIAQRKQEEVTSMQRRQKDQQAKNLNAQKMRQSKKGIDPMEI